MHFQYQWIVTCVSELVSMCRSPTIIRDTMSCFPPVSSMGNSHLSVCVCELVSGIGVCFHCVGGAERRWAAWKMAQCDFALWFTVIWRQSHGASGCSTQPPSHQEDQCVVYCGIWPPLMVSRVFSDTNVLFIFKIFFKTFVTQMCYI